MKPLEKGLLLASAAATTVTGIVYAWMRYLLEPVDPWAVINHPLEPWFLKAHILVAPLLVFAVGMITIGHVWRHLRARVRAGRRSGLLTAWVFGPMVATGYLLQSVTGPVALRWLVGMHLATAILFALGLAIHYVRSPSRRPTPARRPPRDGADGGGTIAGLPGAERAR